MSRILAVLFLALFTSSALAADPIPQPQFGACWNSGLCIGPRVAAPAMAVDLDTGEVEFNILPGFGYGFEKKSGVIEYGVSLFVSTRETSVGRRVMPSIMFDFMKYIHLGVARQFGDERWFGLLTLGTDLGVAPSVVAKPES